MRCVTESFHFRLTVARADLEVQLMQQNHYDEVLSNDWNTLLGQQISQHTAMSMSRYALVLRLDAFA